MICLIIFSYLGNGTEKVNTSTESESVEKFLDSQGNDILVALFFEHVFSYLSANFRKWEIARYGVMDINGIFRA